MKNTIIKLTLALVAITIMSCSTKTESSLYGTVNDEIVAAKEELKGVFANIWDDINSVSEYFKTDVFETLSNINEEGIVESKEVNRIWGWCLPNIFRKFGRYHHRYYC